ncbi:MAG TPA: PAS domain S-box protein, partial [Candidatus Sulfopaludibacter sp.]|nr:PAS domain S-box protein [Candidatus Sulfopaludibacter sp.]
LLANAETGLRGYLLTRRESDLENYRAAREQLPHSLQAVHDLTVDNPSQVERLKDVRARLSQAEQSMELLQQAAASKTETTSKIEADRENLRALRRELTAMQDEEDRVLQGRNTAQQHAQSRLEVTIFAGGVFGLLGGLIAALLFTTGIARRVRLVEEDARKVAEGVPLTSSLGGNDEIARLASTLRQTSQLLAKQSHDLQVANTQLEHRVELRTAELIHANEELQKAIEVREAVLQSSPLAIWAIDREGKVMFWNPAAEQIFGWSAAEVIGKPLPIIVEEQRQEYEQWLHRFLGGESLKGVERGRCRRDGSRIDVSIWTAPLRDTHGAIRGTLAIDSDITQRRLLEEQFRQSQKLEAVGRLAGGVAHDFNNLLTVIMGYVEMLMLEAQDRPDLLGYAEEVQYAAGRASALTGQLLAFSRRQISQPRVLDLNEIVTHSTKLLRRVIGEDLEISTHLDPGLGLVKADPIHIDQVIMNLVVNARDAMGQGGKLTIETAAVTLDENYTGRHIGVTPGPYVMLAISDTGCGMSDETKSRLFEPFFTTKEAGKGTGLGLSIVYGIVKQNGGEIVVYSELGKGTTFKIDLPIAEAPAALPAGEQRTQQARGSETVLVCEDEPGIRKLVIALLTKQGYRVLETENPRDALEILQAHNGSIHLLLTDIVMPRVNGFELARQARALRPNIRVLYMSGYTDNHVSASWNLDPSTPFLHKPFTAATLAQRVREALETPAAAS